MKKSASCGNLAQPVKPIKRVVSTPALGHLDVMPYTDIVKTFHCEVQYVTSSAPEEERQKQLAACVASPPELEEEQRVRVARQSRAWLELSTQCPETAERYNTWLRRLRKAKTS
jgi:hypothetical protein